MSLIVNLEAKIKPELVGSAKFFVKEILRNRCEYEEYSGLDVYQRWD